MNKKDDNTLHSRTWKRFLMLAALVLALGALVAGPASAANERSNSGWYTGLEYPDLPPQPSVQNEHVNSGWYTGLEYAGLPPAQPASSGDGFSVDETALGIAGAVAALLLAATVAVTRSRNGRVTAH
jgi:hypothetical protein